MNKKLVRGLLVAIPAVVAAPMVSAHFKMLSPAGWIVEDLRGDPQKIAPCGGTNADAGKPTGAVTPVKGGGRLTISIDETIFHPGHFRIALARTREALPRTALGRQLLPDDRSLDTHISNLRRKLGSEADADVLIRSIRGSGYVLVPPQA